MMKPNSITKSIDIIVTRDVEAHTFNWETVFIQGGELANIWAACKSDECEFKGDNQKARYGKALEHLFSRYRYRGNDTPKAQTLKDYRSIAEAFGSRKDEIIKASASLRQVRTAARSKDKDAALDRVLAGEKLVTDKPKPKAKPKAKKPAADSRVWHVSMPTVSISPVALANKVSERVDRPEFKRAAATKIRDIKKAFGLDVSQKDFDKVVHDALNVVLEFDGDPAVLCRAWELVNQEIFKVILADGNHIVNQEHINAAE